jgi:hypothetical protein
MQEKWTATYIVGLQSHKKGVHAYAQNHAACDDKGSNSHINNNKVNSNRDDSEISHSPPNIWKILLHTDFKPYIQMFFSVNQENQFRDGSDIRCRFAILHNAYLNSSHFVVTVTLEDIHDQSEWPLSTLSFFVPQKYDITNFNIWTIRLPFTSHLELL